MADIRVYLVIHHGGSILKGKSSKYVRGKNEIVEYDWDIDLLSFPNVMSYVKELWHNEVYYRKVKGRDFIIVNDGKSMMEIGSQLRDRNEL
ncbi:conserved hypothetical protein [Ricinus communis]|uniref:PB1-like domain-containing protein n=1 Tax=Ricinus communis TaxID=3988 RepID=B9SU53_RICCO|nr:conserved hypothetical protein [Ricinus communis]